MANICWKKRDIDNRTRALESSKSLLRCLKISRTLVHKRVKIGHKHKNPRTHTQTNGFRRRHPTFFATLRRWVINSRIEIKLQSAYNNLRNRWRMDLFIVWTNILCVMARNILRLLWTDCVISLASATVTVWTRLARMQTACSSWQGLSWRSPRVNDGAMSMTLDFVCLGLDVACLRRLCLKLSLVIIVTVNRCFPHVSRNRNWKTEVVTVSSLQW